MFKYLFIRIGTRTRRPGARSQVIHRMGPLVRSAACGAAMIGLLMILGGCATVQVNEGIEKSKFDYDTANEAKQRGEYDKALEYYDKAAAQAKRSRWAAAGTYASNKDEVDASLVSLIAACYYNQAGICFKLKRHKDCIKYASDAVHRWYLPGLPQKQAAITFALRGLSYAELGMREEAVQDYRTSLQYDSDNTFIQELKRVLDQ